MDDKESDKRKENVRNRPQSGASDFSDRLQLDWIRHVETMEPGRIPQRLMDCTNRGTSSLEA
jgi:hypothetical protein